MSALTFQRQGGARCLAGRRRGAMQIYAHEENGPTRKRHERTADGLTIGGLATLPGVSAKAIRSYEEFGLLPPPSRGVNHYRRYGPADINRVRLLRRIRLLGAPLSLARSLLIGAHDARCADVRTKAPSLVRERLRAIGREIAELGQLRAQLEGYQRALSACACARAVSPTFLTHSQTMACG